MHRVSNEHQSILELKGYEYFEPKNFKESDLIKQIKKLESDLEEKTNELNELKATIIVNFGGDKKSRRNILNSEDLHQSASNNFLKLMEYFIENVPGFSDKLDELLINNEP